jgi:prepilin-type N-terminal cleavage/methylation domain-containing protein
MIKLRRHATPGFTLVEILTATAIMAVIVGFVMTILTQVLDVWNSNSDELDLSSQAQVGLDLIKQDLQQSYFRRDGSQWLVLTADTPYDPINATTAIGLQAYSVSRLMFFAPTTIREATDSANPPNPLYGDLCAIEYRMTYGPMFVNNSSGPNAGQKVLSLHRAVVDSRSTMLGLFNGTLASPPGSATTATLIAGNPTADLTLAWNGLDTDTIRQGIDNPITLTNPAPTGGTSGNVSIYGGLCSATTVLNNVAQFIVTIAFYDSATPSGISSNSSIGPITYTALSFGQGGSTTNTNPKTLLFPTLPPNVASQTSDVVLDYPGGIPLPPETTTPPPYNLAYADISLTLITDEGAVLFAQNPIQYQSTLVSPGSSMSVWSLFLQQYGRTYTERVYFQNTPE